MAKRDDVVPADLVTHLQKRIPGFSQETTRVQMFLAKMVWVGTSKRRRHKRHQGAMSISYQELYAVLGPGKKGFAEMNKRLGFFEVTSNWHSGINTQGEPGEVKGETKGYWFSGAVQAARDEYIRRDWRKTTKILMMDGTALRTLPRGIDSLDSEKKPARLWGKAKIGPVVRVDLPTLKLLRKWLIGKLRDWDEGRRPSDLFMEFPTHAKLTEYLDRVSKIVRMSMTDIADLGCLPHRYQESPSGRLYAIGVNLQNAPSLIKEAALNGLWEYDFDNCHFNLVNQIAAQAGYECGTIRNYLSSKTATREDVAIKVGITTEQVKTCLIALIYGARFGLREEDAIPGEIGQEAALRLYKLPFFIDLKADITKARTKILRDWPRSIKGQLVNASGKTIDDKMHDRQKLAHLLQGAEAKALLTCYEMYPTDVVLLQHDGFSAMRLLNMQAMEVAVFEATGFRLYLENKQIRMHPERQFLKAQKSVKPSETFAIKGLQRFSDHDFSS